MPVGPPSLGRRFTFCRFSVSTKLSMRWFFFCYAVFRLTAFALLHSLPFSFRAPLAINLINAWDFVGTLNFRLIGLNFHSCPSHSSPFGVILLCGIFHYLRLAASLFIPYTCTNHVSPAYFYETMLVWNETFQKTFRLTLICHSIPI
jgi:hypothetical protein